MESPPNFATGFCTAGFCLLRTPRQNSARDGDGAIKSDQCESETCIKQVANSPSDKVYVYLLHSIRAKIPHYVTDMITLSRRHFGIIERR